LDRRVFVIGLVLIVLSILAGSASAPPLPSLNSTQTYSLAIASNGYAYSTVNVNTTSLFVLSYAAQSPVSFYLLNGSRTSQPSASTVNSLSNLSYTGANAPLIAIINSTRGAVPYVSNYSQYGIPPPVIQDGNVSVLSNGLYYMLFVNNLNRSTNLTYSYTALSISNITGSYLQSSLNASVVPSILFIAGVLVAVFGLFRKRAPKNDGTDEEAQKIFTSQSHESKPHTSHSKKRRTSKS